MYTVLLNAKMKHDKLLSCGLLELQEFVYKEECQKKCVKYLTILDIILFSPLLLLSVVFVTFWC